MSRNTITVRVAVYGICGVLALINAALAQDRPPDVKHISLDEAKSKASGSAAVSKAGQLAVDAAKYHRQAAQADYFPKLSADFLNLHYNKFLGQKIEVVDRRTGVPLFGKEVPLFGKDWTAVSLTVVQPVTQLLQVRQAVAVARADERIAQAKVAQMAAQTAEYVERAYFALLIAQRRQTVAQKKLESIDSTSPLASTVAMTSKSEVDHQAVAFEASKELLTADSEVSELTHSLNTLIGFAPDTKLILDPPQPVTETISLTEATQQAVANSAEVVEAEETLVKARAASRLAKLDYVPGVAVMGGYINQPQAVLPLLPQDFSFIGFTATFNIFDFGKREKTIDERRMQVGMAEANVAMVKSKVAANVQKSFFELERSQRIRDLTRRLAAGYQEAALEDTSARAMAEAEMFQAELDYRSAHSQLQRLINGR
jgi:outer membrane protein TolC